MPEMMNPDFNMTTPSEREIVVTRVFKAPRHLVFEAYTSPDHLPQWMLGPVGWTMPVCEVDLRVDGAWHFLWRNENGTQMQMRGVYREITPPSRLVTSESWGGDWPEFLNRLDLSEENGQTTATIQLLYPSQETRDAVLKTGMTEGMEVSFKRLADYLDNISKLRSKAS